MKLENCPSFLRPRLRLFLSADIVGSTALKQGRFTTARTPEDAKKLAPWYPIIQSFYIEAQRTFLSEWNKVRAASSQPEIFGDPPEFWKSIGDEVLFVKVVSDHRQVLETVSAWQNAIGSLRSLLKRVSRRLDVKSVIWTAGFPLQNKEVVTGALDSFLPIEDGEYFKESGRLLESHYERSLDAKIQIDYIGPSIDTGFRLAAFATSRRMIVSVDVAYILSLTNYSQHTKRIELFYSGSTLLKGVFGGVDYPLFWIDNGHGALPEKEDKLTELKACERDRVTEYCDAYFDENSDYIFKPFIESATEQNLIHQPSEYEEALKNLIKNFVYKEGPAPEGEENAPSTLEYERAKEGVLQDIGDPEDSKASEPKGVTLKDDEA